MAGDTLKDSRGRFVNVHRSRLRVTMSIKEAEMATLNYFKYSIYYIYIHTHTACKPINLKKTLGMWPLIILTAVNCSFLVLLTGNNPQ